MIPQSAIKKIQRLHTRHGRRKSEFMLCEGLRCCREALRQPSPWLELLVLDRSLAEQPECQEILNLAGQAAVMLYQVDSKRFASLALTESPQGILALLRRPAFADLSQPSPDPFVLILDNLADPGNFGTIARTAWAVGLRELWITQGTTDPYGPKAMRAGMGAQFDLRIKLFADLDEVAATMHQQGLGPLWRSTPVGGTSCYSDYFRLPQAGLLIGNEAHGSNLPRRLAVPVADLTIPMPGNAESLNAAQAATLLLFEAVRRSVLT